MAVTWGSARTTSTNGMRVGLELRHTVSGATATIHWEIWLWTRRAAFNSDASYSVDDGVSSGSFSFSHSNNSSDWPTSNRTRVAQGSFTRALQYGSTQSVGIVGRIWGVSAVSGTATHSRSVTLPARGFNAPAAPSGAFVFPESNYTRARLEWTRNHTAAAPYQSIHVERRHMQGDGTFTAWTRRANLADTAESFTDSITGNNHFHYRVRANNTAGNSPWLDMGRLNTVPPTPSSVRAQHVNDDIRVTWSQDARVPSSQVRTVVQHSADGGAWTTVATLNGLPSSWTHRAPSILQTHRYRVRLEVTEWGSATGGWGTSSTVELAAPPAAPTGLGPTTAWDATQARVFTWRHVPTDGSEQTRYQVRRRLQGATTWTTTGEVASSDSRYTLPARTYSNGAVVEVQVRTWGSHPDASPWSASMITVTQARPTVSINIPDDGQVIDRSAVGVRWGFNQEQGLPQTGWRVELRRDGVVVQSLSGSHANVNAVTVRGLENGTTYELAVGVRSGPGWSDWDTVTITVEFVPPPTPAIDVTWDVDLGATVIQIEHPPWTTEHAEPAYAQVWRAIDDGPWLLIADEVPLDTAVTDPIPAIGDGTVNYYKATAVSVLPSTADSAVVPLMITPAMAHHWMYLNTGPGMSTVVRLRGYAERSSTEGVQQVLRRFAGRKKRVAYSGTVDDLDWTVNAWIGPHVEGAATRAELLTVQRSGEVCYRDPSGARWFAVMDPITDTWDPEIAGVTLTMSEVEFVEGLAYEDHEGGGGL